MFTFHYYTTVCTLCTPPHVIHICMKGRCAHHRSSRAGVGMGNRISCGIPHSPPDSVLLKRPGLCIHGHIWSKEENNNNYTVIIHMYKSVYVIIMHTCARHCVNSMYIGHISIRTLLLFISYTLHVYSCQQILTWCWESSSRGFQYTPCRVWC